jgi:type I restriction enzyme S subunit
MEAVMDKIKVEKYSSYKNSGAEWLGDIPMHWNTLSNKNIFKLKKNTRHTRRRVSLPSPEGLR